MKQFLFVFLLLSSFQLLKADDIYFKNGHILYNVLVKDTIKSDDGLYYIRVNLAYNKISAFSSETVIETKSFLLDTVERIEISEFNINNKTNMVERKLNYDGKYVEMEIEKKGKISPRILLSLLSFGLSWDFFVDASKANDAAKLLVGDTKTEMENIRFRKTLLGIVFTATGILNIFLSIEEVEVGTNKNGLAISYNF